MKAISFEGKLQTYFETGMEGMGLQLFIDHEKYLTPNPQFDPNDPKKGPEFYHSWDGTVTIKKLDTITILKVYSEKLKKYEGKEFVVGNLEWAAKDGYRFGAIYPFEEIPLVDWYELFASDNTRAILTRPIRRVAYYGGTFDPIHEGHLQIIQELIYNNDLVLVMPGNNWTKNKPLFTINERLKSVKGACDRYPNVIVLDWAKDKDFNSASTYNVAKRIKEEFEVSPDIVIGADNVKGIENWKNWNKLKSFRFVIFQRGDEKLSEEDLIKFKDPIYWSHFRSIPISSTEIKRDNLVDKIPKSAQKHLKLSKMSRNEK